MVAESGHEQRSWICLGAGNRPVSLLEITSITALESLPWSSSTTESIWPLHAATTAFQRAGSTGPIPIVTVYSDVPCTRATSLPGSICRSMTAPLRT